MTDPLASALRRREALAACVQAARAGGDGHPFALLRDGPGLAGLALLRRLHGLGDPAGLPDWAFNVVFRPQRRSATALAVALAAMLASRQDLLTREARDGLAATFGAPVVRAALALRPPTGARLGAGAGFDGLAATGVAAIHAALRRDVPEAACWLTLLDGEPPPLLLPSFLPALVEPADALLASSVDGSLVVADSEERRRWG
jgi:hypothetical protein